MTFTPIIHRAREAQKIWKTFSVKERGQHMIPAGNYVIDHIDDIVRVLQEDNGKPPVEGLAHEILSALHALKWMTGHAPRILKPKHLSLSLFKHKKSTLYYIPHGVIGIISPWNFPLSIPFGEVVTALIAGNAVILKPSEVTPRVGHMIQTIMKQMTLPEGLFQCVEGGPDVGKALVASAVDKIIFTGSSRTGQQVMHACVDQFKPYGMELGGKDAMVVLEDADVDVATSAVVWGGMSNAGQACSSVERVYVQEKIFDRFRDQLLEKIKKLRLEGDLGRITYEKQKDVYDRQLKDAHQRGKILLGGQLTSDRKKMLPTVVMGEDTLLCAQEETFGPLIYLSTFKEAKEVIEKVNASPYGLLASIWTHNTDAAELLAQEIIVGTVIVNDVMYTHALAETPWGGRKHSGVGHTHGELGLMEMVYPLHVNRNRLGFLFKPFWWFPYSERQYEFLKAFGMVVYSRGWLRRVQGVGKFLKSLPFLWREPRA